MKRGISSIDDVSNPSDLLLSTQGPGLPGLAVSGLHAIMLLSFDDFPLRY